MAATALAPPPGLAAPSTITRLASFDGKSNGQTPIGQLIVGPDGLFYGTTSAGGTLGSGEPGQGTVFSFDGKSITTLASFDGKNGSGPLAGLTAGPKGTFFGTTGAGGESNLGSIFSLILADKSITSLASFTGKPEGSQPISLTPGPSGSDLYYGTTFNGGANDWGSIFSFSTTKNSITTLASFDFSNGSYPSAALTPGPGGIFYGTTSAGGERDVGTIFSFNGETIASLASFDGENGSNPRGLTATREEGIFYGISAQGGAKNNGSIFSFDGKTITSLISFDGENGRSPIGTLTAGPDGLYYGVTQFGGKSDVGTIFSFDGKTITSLASFDRDNGASPESALTFGPDGILYGTTTGGGEFSRGTIFSFETAAVPGPLPILGVGMAFGWSRRIRKRIRDAKRGQNSNSLA